MLVLTRKVSERFMIGNDIVVTVVKIDGRQVRIGIDAPRDVVIRRTELKRLDGDDGPSHSADPMAGLRSHMAVPRLDHIREIS